MEPIDLQGPEIPAGQQRLILHLVKVIKSQAETKSVTDQELVANHQPAPSNTDPGLGSGQTSQPPTTQSSATTQPPLHSSQPSATQTHQADDLYGAAITNSMIAEQQQLRAHQIQGPASYPDDNNSQRHDSAPQPSWNDPQIHLSTATGKSVCSHYDICDFVQCNIEEDTIIGCQGTNRLW